MSLPNFKIQSLQNRLLAWFIAVSLGPLVVFGVIGAYTIAQERDRGVRDDLAHRASQAANRVNDFFGERVREAQSLAGAPVVRQAASEGARIAHERGLERKSIDELEKLFDETRSLETSPAASEFLAEQRARSYFSRTFATDRNGFNVITSQRTEDFVQSDEAWWQEAFHKGLYISPVKHDNMTGLDGIEIAVAIYVPKSSEAIGVFKAWFDCSSVRSILAATKIGKTGRTQLIDSSGAILATSTPELLFHTISNQRLVDAARRDSAGVIETSAYEGTSPGDQLVAFEPVKNAAWMVLVSQSSEEAFAEVRHFFLIAAGVAVVGCALVVMAALFVARSVTAPITQVKTMVGEMAESVRSGCADLSLTISADREDELGEMVRSINTLLGVLEETVSSVQDTSHVLASSSAQLASENSSFSERVAEQSAWVEQTVTTMEQMARQVRGNAESAREVSQQMVDLRRNAESTGRMMEKLISAVQESGDSAERIAGMVTLIEDIAFQTNLLALNAAVEAARAGENGRGFAVVASEVRTLAQRAGTAATEINTTLAESTARHRKGGDMAERSGKALADVISKINHVADVAAQIARSSDEQSAGIQQVNDAIGRIDQTMQQNSAMIEETAATTEELSSQAHSMWGLVSGFQGRNSRDDAPEAARWTQPDNRGSDSTTSFSSSTRQTNSSAQDESEYRPVYVPPMSNGAGSHQRI